MLADLADDIFDALSDECVEVIVTRMIESGPPHNPTLTPEPHSGSGFTDDFRLDDVNGSLIQATDRRIFVLSRSLGSFVPEPGDFVTVFDTTGTITQVRTDPARAAWEVIAQL